VRGRYLYERKKGEGRQRREEQGREDKEGMERAPLLLAKTPKKAKSSI